MFEDTKGVIKIRRRTENKMAKRKRTKRQTKIHKTTNRKPTKNQVTRTPLIDVPER
jgi:hypothetical protein